MFDKRKLIAGMMGGGCECGTVWETPWKIGNQGYSSVTYIIEHAGQLVISGGYLGSSSSGQGIHRSTDGGKTLTEISGGSGISAIPPRKIGSDLWFSCSTQNANACLKVNSSMTLTAYTGYTPSQTIGRDGALFYDDGSIIYKEWNSSASPGTTTFRLSNVSNPNSVSTVLSLTEFSFAVDIIGNQYILKRATQQYSPDKLANRYSTAFNLPTFTRRNGDCWNTCYHTVLVSSVYYTYRITDASKVLGSTENPLILTTSYYPGNVTKETKAFLITTGTIGGKRGVHKVTKSGTSELLYEQPGNNNDGCFEVGDYLYYWYVTSTECYMTRAICTCE